MADPFTKDTDGFMARHFDRHISGAISRQLLKTPITPNQITIFVIFLGTLAGLSMAQPGQEWKVLGALTFLMSSILDGCDGEVARVKKMTSRLGGWLDFWGDNIVHVAIFYGLGLGLYRDSGDAIFLTLGRVAAGGTLISAAVASYQMHKKSSFQNPSGQSLFTSVIGDAAKLQGKIWQERLVRWSDALARRDFIYVVVALALINHLDWFLWACAFGTNAYALVLLGLLIVTPR